MSVCWDEGRTELEEFCRAARHPAQAGPSSPFNQLIEPDPDQLLRVAVGLGFRRGPVNTSTRCCAARTWRAATSASRA